MNGLDRAVSHFGSQSSLARTLGVCPMAVSHWRRRGVPLARAIAIERATAGVVTRAELRPDIFGPLDEIRDRGAT
ncbi:helix-turn-helix domain-containing protein [Acidithiobacillus sp. HP-6]|uniref:transcriptional regulator n=1 Tax=Acidithiobacillus TaxID=119977 RepID=UPI0009DAB538|nr:MULTISPECIES: Cro/CI family transcriptional regulator [Acidithiobacillus]MBE7564194.1 helix-turn-helix domain-containing protein [Acidithiobacillus sp. HP-6]MBE7569112.1 helix-turn-helix domain-containing protein [Acidithiobacillus sp. HP-2]MDA8154579.1 Cro/CI family transcriptional regulator [Acidithiobacillus sp.]